MKKHLPLLIFSLFLTSCAHNVQYVGERNEKGEYHGQGTLTAPDGSKYVGEWKDNKYDGQGTITYADGEKWEGEFKDGALYTGHGTYFLKGYKYIGELKDGKPKAKTEAITTGIINIFVVTSIKALVVFIYQRFFYF